MHWDEENMVSDGGPAYPEVWRKGVFAQSIRRAQSIGRGWPLMFNHNKEGMPVGMVSMIHERADGPWATAKISRTTLGDDIRELVADGALGVSVSGLAIRSRKGLNGVIERMEVAVQEISVTPFPSLKGSDELVLRSQQLEEVTVDGSVADLQAFMDGLR
jgi:HK97 family phage prohead protease